MSNLYNRKADITIYYKNHFNCLFDSNTSGPSHIHIMNNGKYNISNINKKTYLDDNELSQQKSNYRVGPFGISSYRLDYCLLMLQRGAIS